MLPMGPMSEAVPTDSRGGSRRKHLANLTKLLSVLRNLASCTGLIVPHCYFSQGDNFCQCGLLTKKNVMTLVVYCIGNQISCLYIC